VGYPNAKKGWPMHDLEIHEFFVSRDVKFFETVFPFASSLVNDFSLPSDLGASFFYLGDDDDLEKGGNSAIASHEDNEGFPVHDTAAQESHGHDEPEILQEELFGRGHRQKKT